MVHLWEMPLYDTYCSPWRLIDERSEEELRDSDVTVYETVYYAENYEATCSDSYRLWL